MSVVLAPSLYSAGLQALPDVLACFEEQQVKLLHLDIMDGHFVEEMAFGLSAVRDLHNMTSIPLDVHLMVEKPERIVDALIDLAPLGISFHVEATHHAYRLLQKIKQNNIRAGIALNPGTPVEAISALLPVVDCVLVMSVNPGVAGERFLEATLEKVITLSRWKQEKQLCFEIEVDGKIDLQSAILAQKAGATILVSGGYLFQGELSENLQCLQTELAHAR